MELAFPRVFKHLKNNVKVRLTVIKSLRVIPMFDLSIRTRFHANPISHFRAVSVQTLTFCICRRKRDGFNVEAKIITDKIITGCVCAYG